MSGYDLDNLADFAEALASRERADEWFGDPREEGSAHPDAVADLRARFGDPSWCPGCSREVTPFDGQCSTCGTQVEELGTGDDDPYPGEDWR